MKNHLTLWLFALCALSMASNPVLALSPSARDHLKASAAGYTKHERPDGALTNFTPDAPEENIVQRLLEKTGHNFSLSLSPAKRSHVAINTDRPPPIKEVRKAVSEAEAHPQYNPVSLALLGLCLLCLAGISRKIFAKK